MREDSEQTVCLVKPHSQAPSLNVSAFGLRLRLPPSAMMLGANGLISLAAFLVSVIQAKLLAPEGRGALAEILLWPMLLSQLSLLGVHLFLARETGRSPTQAGAYYRVGYAVVAVCCGVATVAWIGTSLVLPVFDGTTPDLLIVALSALIIPFSAWNAMQVQIELGRGSIGTYNWARLGFTAAHTALVVGLWMAGVRSVAAFVGAFTAATAVAAISAHFLIRHAVGGVARPEVHVPTLTVAQIAKGSWPYALSTTVLSVSTMADRIVVATLFDARTLGLYVVAFAMSQLQSVVNEALSPLFFNRAGQHYSIADMDQAWLGKRMRQTVVINALISASLAVAAPILLPLIYGKLYDEALIVALLLIPAVGVRSMMRPFEEVLKGGAKAHGQSIAIVAMMIVFVVGSVIAAPFGGVVSVAAALMISSLTGLAIVSFLVARAIRCSVTHLLVPRFSDCVALAVEISRLVRR